MAVFQHVFNKTTVILQLGGGDFHTMLLLEYIKFSKDTIMDLFKST